MVALTACTQRRAERDEVEAFLAARTAARTAAHGAAQGAARLEGSVSLHA